MRTKTTREFIEEAKLIHGNKYDYSLVNYINNSTKVKIKCNCCGKYFMQVAGSHLKHDGCFCYKNDRKSLKQFIEEANKVHNNKYDYSLVNYINNSTKVKIICKLHGIFEQIPKDHINKKYNCPRCSNITNLTDFIEKANKIHNNKYDYKLSIYINARTKIKIICPKHGIFEQMPYVHLNGSGCPYCKNSHGEEKIFSYLTKNKISFETQKTFDDLKNKRKLSYDFYIPNKDLLIEYNGKQHYINGFGSTTHEWHKQLHRDWLKRKYAKENGITLLVIPYTQFNNINKILEEKLV